ncbi:MAG: hypothetical protein M5U34_25945 [Chloroflexi bacterium]|nr:hypothetical protein [Chloroflexota bacterium]
MGVARRRRILDLGAGYGAVTGELVRRGVDWWWRWIGLSLRQAQ